MSEIQWTLDVLDLGGKTLLGQTSVSADNWMSALQHGRASLGEAAAMPAGASCSVGVNGVVTILDAMQRRRYVLTPGGGGASRADRAARAPTPQRPSAAPMQPRAAQPQPPQPQPPQPQPLQHRPRQPSPPQPPTRAAAPMRPPAGRPAVAQPAPAQPAPAQPAPAQPAPAQPAPAQPAPAQPAPAQPAPAQPAPARPAPAQPPVAASAAEPRKKRKRHTMAYGATDLPADLQEQMRAFRAQLEGQGPGAPAAAPVPARPAPTAPPAAPPPAAPPPAAPPPAAQPPSAIACSLLSQRDEEPSEQTPLRYRERSYFVEGVIDQKQAETVLRARLSEIQRELIDKPRGKFVNLALFDHPWKGSPGRAPIATLQWKDWKEGVEIAFQGSSQAASGDPRADEALDLCQDLFFLRTRQEGLNFALDLLQDLIPHEASRALLNAGGGAYRRVAVGGGASASTLGTTIDGRRGIFAAAAGNGAPLVIQDVRSDGRFDAATDGEPGIATSSVISAPILISNSCVGMVQLINAKAQRGFSDGDALVIGVVAQQLARFLTQAQG